MPRPTPTTCSTRPDSRRAIAGEAQPRELPARLRREEVAIGRADVRSRRHARAAAQHVLPAHELAVVFADSARRGPETGIGRVIAARPLPRVTVGLGEVS